MACACTLTLASGTRSVCREVANGSLSRQGERVRSPDNCYKIAAGEPSIPETRGHVLGPRAGRKTRARSTFKNHRENEPDMTTYPLDFHRRFEQKWVLRAQASSAREGSAQEAVVGSRSVKRGQRRSGQPERRDILARMPWLMELGQWLRPSTMRPTNVSRNVSPRSWRSLGVAVPECPANVAATVTTSVPHRLIHAAPAGPSPESTSPPKRRTKVTLARGLCLAI